MNVFCRYFVVFLLVLASANALTADASLELALAQCQSIAPDKDRLSCYDAIAARGNIPKPVAVAPVVTPSVASVAPVPQEPVAIDAEPQPDPQQLPKQAADFGKETVRGSEGPDILIGRVVNDFSGWEGDAVFELDNGQVWVQVDSSKLRYRGAENPEVTIRRRAFGAYRLSVEGSNKTVRVRRRR